VALPVCFLFVSRRHTAIGHKRLKSLRSGTTRWKHNHNFFIYHAMIHLSARIFSCLWLLATTTAFTYDPPPLPSTMVMEQRVQVLPATLLVGMNRPSITGMEDFSRFLSAVKIDGVPATPAPTMQPSRPAFTQPAAGAGGVIVPVIAGKSARPAGFLPTECGNASPFAKAVVCPDQV
jgi:hypothetical protein